MGDLSKNFSRSEFACSGKNCCGHSAPVTTELVSALQELRDIVGKPMHINSGFRCRVHNAEIDGAKESYHCLGMAADVAIPECLTPQQFAVMAEKVGAFERGGIGTYKSWIHVDVRNGKTRWAK